LRCLSTESLPSKISAALDGDTAEGAGGKIDNKLKPQPKALDLRVITDVRSALQHVIDVK
jgi:hypothetical protein